MSEKPPIPTPEVTDERSQEELKAELSQALKRLDALRTKAYEDGLTETANRRAYEEALALFLDEYHSEDIQVFLDELQSTEGREVLKRNPERLGKGSVMMLDIDKFKQVNDTYGHDAGDAVLKNFAQVIQRVIRRENDLLFRMGGEEFLVLLPNTDEHGAGIIADRIRAQVGLEKIDIEGLNEPLTITVSIGVAAVLPQTTIDGDTFEGPSNEAAASVTKEDVINAVKQSDDALYGAKEAGRNQVEAASTRDI